MYRMMLLTTSFIFSLAQPSFAQDPWAVFQYLNPVFQPIYVGDGQDNTWTFRNKNDNAVARILIDEEGRNDGGPPNGYAELVLRAQDEIHDALGHVLASSDVHGTIRVMSNSYAWTDTGDPTRLTCRGTQCGGQMEFYSDGNVRFTAGGGKSIDWVTNNRRRLLLKDGEFYFPSLADPSYGPPPGIKNYACFGDNGQLVSQPNPCR